MQCPCRKFNWHPCGGVGEHFECDEEDCFFQIEAIPESISKPYPHEKVTYHPDWIDKNTRRPK